MPNLDQKDFNARIKRIKSPSNNAYYDPELEMHVPKRTNAEQIRKDIKSQKFSITRVIVSVLIGVVAVMIAQALRIRYLSVSETSNTSLFVDVLFTLFAMLVLSGLMGHRKKALRIGQIAGVAAMFLAGHNLMWFYPKELAIIYSTPYVDAVLAQTEPMSVNIPEPLRNLAARTTDS